MNATRRKAISELVSRAEQLKADIETIAEEENEFYDNMPESFQSGEKGDRATEVISNLEEAANLLDDIISNLDEAKE